MKVLLKSALNPYSGYGQDGVDLARALLKAGLDVYVDPTFVSGPLPSSVAVLLTRRLEAPFDLLIHHVDPGQLGLSPQARRAAKVTVAHTMWEYTSLDNLKGRGTLRKRLTDYDVVLGYDSVTTGAFERYINPTKTGLGVLQGGFWPDDWPFVSRDWDSGRFGFCMVGALHERKDPFVAIQAHKELKEEYPEEYDGAELHLKTTQLGLHPAMEHWVPKLRVHYDTWPDDVLHEFYASQHVLLAPSRGEGKNMPALEMQATGGAVIATNWGGHTQWLSPAYAYPLDYTLKPVSAKTPNCLNARASKEHLKALMLHTYRNRDEVRAKAEKASKLIGQMCSWQTVIDRMFLRLNDLAPGGDRLLDRARRQGELAKGHPGLANV